MLPSGSTELKNLDRMWLAVGSSKDLLSYLNLFNIIIAGIFDFVFLYICVLGTLPGDYVKQTQRALGSLPSG